VQRVPQTEAQGRIHTSTATVAVLAEANEIEIDIPEKDIKMDVYRSAGAGGQNVQKNATAVRLTHLPTGIVVQCQDERSQLQNRTRAMSILRARLYNLAMEKQQAEIDSARRSQVGSGEARRRSAPTTSSVASPTTGLGCRYTTSGGARRGLSIRFSMSGGAGKRSACKPPGVRGPSMKSVKPCGAQRSWHR
jgi:protein subunit release factor B